MPKVMLQIDTTKTAGNDLNRAISLLRQGKRELDQIVDHMLSNTDSGDFTSIPFVFGVSRKEAQGIAQSGGVSAITLDAADAAIDDFYNGMLIEIVGGLGQGQIRKISDFVNLSNVATVSAAWSTQPDDTSQYIIYGTADVIGEYIYNLSNGAKSELAADTNLNSLIDQVIAE